MKPTYEEKRLTETDSERLVSGDWIRNNGGRAGVLPVPVSGSEAIPDSIRDEWGMDYPLRLKVRSPKPGKRYFSKPEIMSKGWRAFVADKRLEVGDKVFIYGWTEAISESKFVTLLFFTGFPRAWNIFSINFDDDNNCVLMFLK